MTTKIKKEKSLFDEALDEFERQLTPTKVSTKKEERDQKTSERIPLSEFVERTCNFELEPWQIHLCKRLEKLTHQKGQRILIHKPPQHGGSVVVSQRLPAYLIGDDPTTRVKVACYNIDHATVFTGINRGIMLTAEYQSMFEYDDIKIPVRSPDKGFYTRARRSFRDGQPSLMALGLLTGFVGQGADHLIIDDPYASPQDAMSPAVNKSVWTFWAAGAKVRIDENCNVVIMFHRYHEDDFVGRLIKEEGLQSQGGRWELISYRAEWDGDESLLVGGPDPMNRKKGGYLSPRKAAQPGYYKEQKINPGIWLSQFQGKPTREEGNKFKIAKLRLIPMLPKTVKLLKICRSWDVASSENKGDWTVGVKGALGDDDVIYILDVVRFRKDTYERDVIIRETAMYDRMQHRNLIDSFIITMPQDPSGAGKDQALAFVKLLKGFTVTIVQSFNRGNKEVKADPFSSYVNSGLVCLVYSGDIFQRDMEGEYVSWVPEYVSEMRSFPARDIDDQIDASADCYSQLALDIEDVPGEDFDTYGFNPDFGKRFGKELDIGFTEETVDDLAQELLDEANNSGYEEFYGNPVEIQSEGINYGDNFKKFQDYLAEKTNKERYYNNNGTSKLGSSAERKAQSTTNRRRPIVKRAD